MAIQRNFVLRYREIGHLRFQIPAEACATEAAKVLTEKLLDLDGVYRVMLYPRQRKLSIRFQETVCNFESLAKQLYHILADIEQTGVFNPKPIAKSRRWKGKVPVNQGKPRDIGWFKQKYTDAKDTIQAAKVVGKIGLKKQKALLNDPEKAIIDFLNDILVLFLIKLHWQHITQQWIVKPYKYRYEWMAIFYMFYLLIRSRKK